MTFLIEPGLAASQANSRFERAEPKPSQTGSGDAFAHSLQADRSATEESADTSASAKDKKPDSEHPQSTLSLLQGDDSDVALKDDVLTETDDPDASGDAAIVPNNAEEVLAQESEPELEPAEAPEETKDGKEVFLTNVVPAPSDAAQAIVETESAENVKSDSDAVPQELANAQSQDSPPPSDVQAMTVQAASSGEARQNIIGASNDDARLDSTVQVKGSAEPATETLPQQFVAASESKKGMVPADEPASGKASDAFQAELSEVSSEAGTDTGKTGTLTQTAHTPDSNGQLAAASFGASPVSQPAVQPAQSQIQMTTANAIVTASPAETVKIITDTVSSPNDPPDRITVQLDPPELGRVSIDFKFDAHGIQHITVTGDSPEALRQLRLMHFELTQALERNGLSSENMTFQQHQSGQQQSHTPADGRLLGDSDPVAEPAILTAANITADSIRPARTASGGLDIRL